MTLYFAYGSNMSLDMMIQTCGEYCFESLGSARLTGYRLAFNRESKRWGHGVADIVPMPENVMWGVLYRIDEYCLSQLNIKETLGRGYDHLQINVLDRHGTTHNALTYTVINKLPQDIAPSWAYIQTILTGAHEHQLPADYITTLQAILPAD